MIQLSNIVATYTTVRGEVNAVDGLDLEFDGGRIIGIAGESGCGKTTLLRVLYGDLEYPLSLKRGTVRYGFSGRHGQEVTERNIRKYWFRKISYIPQSSMSSLNPVQRVRKQFVDFQGTRGRGEQERTLSNARQYFRELGLPVEAMDAYPHQLSGGMRQRVMVALATLYHPEIILADEPTTALDVVVQKGILILLRDLQKTMRNTIFFVSHDMGVQYQIAHKMLIMYAAKAVEYGGSDAIFESPLHPYTLMLIDSLPTVGDDSLREGVAGRPPSLWDDLHGCRFAPRCPQAMQKCVDEEPDLTEVRPGRFVACHFPVRPEKRAGRQ